MPEAAPVLSLIIRKFRSSDMDAVNEVLVRFEQALRRQPGFVEVRHNAPSAESEAFSTIIAFATTDDLVAWEQSQTRDELVRELAQYIEGEVMKNQLLGIESLLGQQGASPHPKKWKTVLVLTFWVLVVGAVLNWIADMISPDYPTGYPRTVVLLIFNILLNSYFFLPKSMALLHRFEERRRKKRSGP